MTVGGFVPRYGGVGLWEAEPGCECCGEDHDSRRLREFEDLGFWFFLFDFDFTC